MVTDTPAWSRTVRPVRIRPERLRAVIYARVSKDDKKTMRSPRVQEYECREYVTAQGWDVVKVFIDDDRSASRHARKEREKFQKLIAYVNENPIDVVVCWEVSRWSRRPCSIHDGPFCENCRGSSDLAHS